jgi:TPR repeat protein
VRISFLVIALAIGCSSKKAPEGDTGSGSAGSGSGSGSGSGAKKLPPKEAAALFDKQCLADDFEACRRLGVMYTEGDGVTADTRRATALFVKACNGNNLAGCNHLGLAFSVGMGVDKDAAKAAEIYEKACGAGYVLSCRNLGVMLRDGRDVPQDFAKAEPLLERACKGGAPFGCTNAGDLDAMILLKSGAGSGSAAPSAEAKERAKKMIDHWTQGCNAGDPIGCRKVGIVYLEGKWLPHAPATAVVWLEKGVRGNDAVAMRYFGMMKFDGFGTARDAKLGAELLKRACAMQDEEACREARKLPIGPVSPGSGSGASTPGSGAGGSGTM